MSAAYPELERGESSRETGRRHIPIRLFKQSVNLTKQAQKIQATLDDIRPFNAGKKRDEAMALLDRWFPQMENFEGQLKKYRNTIDLLERENAVLAQKAAANSENGIKHQLEVGRLKSEVRELRRFKEAIPPDLKAEMQARQREQQNRNRRER